jgi:CRP-like cAMP-binding protein
MNQTILEENEQIKYIYFVKHGNVKIYSNRSIIQNHLLIEIINNILEKKNSILLGGKSSDSFLNVNLYPEIKGDLLDILNEIKIKKSIHLMNYQEKQCIGFECFYFGFNSLYSAIAASEKVEVYKISIDKLIKILTVKNKKALNDFARQSEKAIKILLNRIIIMNCSLLNKYSLQNNEIAHKINILFDKAINLIQKQNNKIKGNTINLKIKALKKIGQINTNYTKDNNDFLSSKRKTNSVENFKSTINQLNKKSNSKKMIIFNKFNKNESNSEKDNDNNVDLFKKYDLTAQIKIFDQKANMIQQKYRELERENCELGRLADAENRTINHLKKQNIYCQDFFKLSQGDKRIFIKNRNNSLNTNNIQHHYSLKGKTSLCLKKNISNKEKKLLNLNKFRNHFKEEFPFNSRYDSYKPYKYDLSKTMLVNKKRFEFNLFNRKKNASCDYNDKINLYKYKSISDVDIHKYNLKKKKMIIINFQDYYIK